MSQENVTKTCEWSREGLIDTSETKAHVVRLLDFIDRNDTKIGKVDSLWRAVRTLLSVKASDA